MTDREKRGGAAGSLWDELLAKRLAVKAQLLAVNPNLTSRQLSRALWDVGFETSPADDTVALHAGTDPGMSNPHDVDDAFELEAKDPIISEEDMIMGRLRALQSKPEQTK